MKDIVGIIAPLYILQEWIELFSIIQLWPIGIAQHIFIGVVDIAAFIPIVPVGSSLMMGIGIWT
jgi:hypothetical protein